MGVNGLVRAAGGVISRQTRRGETEVLLIYRGGIRDDWTFPKGKLEAGETDSGCALREVYEETCLSCELGQELPSTSYRDRRGRPKVVRYWAMKVVRGRAAARNEVERTCWLGMDAALARLTYARDRELLAAFGALTAPALYNP